MTTVGEYCVDLKLSTSEYVSESDGRRRQPKADLGGFFLKRAGGLQGGNQIARCLQGALRSVGRACP